MLNKPRFHRSSATAHELISSLHSEAFNPVVWRPDQTFTVDWVLNANSPSFTSLSPVQPDEADGVDKSCKDGGPASSCLLSTIPSTENKKTLSTLCQYISIS